MLELTDAVESSREAPIFGSFEPEDCCESASPPEASERYENESDRSASAILSCGRMESSNLESSGNSSSNLLVSGSWAFSIGSATLASSVTGVGSNEGGSWAWAAGFGPGGPLEPNGLPGGPLPLAPGGIPLTGGIPRPGGTPLPAAAPLPLVPGIPLPGGPPLIC